MTNLDNLARQHDAYVKSDGRGFRRRTRILQSIWREEQGIESGQYQTKSRLVTLGSLLPMPEAQETLSNYITDNIQDVVRSEVLDKKKSEGKVYTTPRIFNNLLSSQPMCFNLFGELKVELALASAVFRQLTSGRLDSVTDIEFEWSPGRAEPKYTNDKSAFDVYVKGRTATGGDAFIGIEVKYHENLRDKVDVKQEKLGRYFKIADRMRCFRLGCCNLYIKSPLHQIWRDHLLAGIHRLVDPFDDGFFVFLYPKDNTYCSTAAEVYMNCLISDDTFEAWTLEKVVNAINNHTSDQWIDQFYDRYLNFDKLKQI